MNRANGIFFRLFVASLLIVFLTGCIGIQITPIGTQYSDVEFHVKFYDDEHGDMNIFLSAKNEIPSSEGIGKLEDKLRRTNFKSIYKTEVGYEIHYEFENINEFNNQINDFIRSQNIEKNISIESTREKEFSGYKYYFKINITNKVSQPFNFESWKTLKVYLSPPGEITYYNEGEKSAGRIFWEIKDMSANDEHILEIKSEKKEIPQPVAYGIFIIIGSLIGVCGQWTVFKLNEIRKKDKIKKALKVEIRNNLTELENIKEIVQEVDKNSGFVIRCFDFEVPFQTTFFTAHMTEMGIFDYELLQKISTLYWNYKIIELRKKDMKTIDELGPAYRSEFIKKFNEVVDEAIQYSKDVLEKL